MSILVEDRIMLAKTVPIEIEIERRGIKLRGRIERVGPCPRCGGIDRFGVSVRKQVFLCRGCGARGDVIALVQFLDGCDFATAVATLAGDPLPASNPTEQATRAVKQAQAIERAKVREIERERELREDEAAKHRWAMRMWSESVPGRGTIAEVYLHSRGVDPVVWPATLRFLPANGLYPPSMIAPFGLCDEPNPGVLTPPDMTADDAIVHVTRLLPDGSGKAVPATGDPWRTKQIIGAGIGLPITLAAPDDGLAVAICEGIEDALAIHQATGLGAWAAGAAGRMPALAGVIPAYIECVTIFAHADQAGEKGALALARALSLRGVETMVDGLA